MKIRKSPTRALTAMALSVMLMSCASSEARLSDRGLSPKDRREYMTQNGFGLSKEIQRAFVEGRLVEGMSRDMVLHIFGTPDRTSNEDGVWEYVNRRGQDVVGVRFKSDRIVQIYGDPFGRTHKPKASVDNATP